MADVVDIANDNQGIILNALIKEQSKEITPFVNQKMECLNCGERVDDPSQKFCCSECEVDFRKRKESEKRRFGNGQF